MAGRGKGWREIEDRQGSEQPRIQGNGRWGDPGLQEVAGGWMRCQLRGDTLLSVRRVEGEAAVDANEFLDVEQGFAVSCLTLSPC